MPHAALVTSALYTLPRLVEWLSEINAVPGPVGYEAIKSKYGKGITAPAKRTVEKVMLNGDFVKYETCCQIIDLLNVARKEMQLDLLDKSSIAEHEFYIERFQRKLELIGRRHGGLSLVKKDLSDALGRPMHFITSLCKNSRTTYDGCAAVMNAVQEKYGVVLNITNQPLVIATKKPRKRRRGRVKAIPPTLI